MTTRRQYIHTLGWLGTAVAVGLAGCIGDRSTRTDDQTNDSHSPTDDGTDGSNGLTDGGTDDSDDTRPSGTGGPGVAITAVDGELDGPISPSVEVVREAATTDHPPRLRTTLTNTGEERVRVGEGRAVHFEHVRDDSGSLVLLPGDGEYPAAADCWRLTEPLVTSEEYRTFEIDAGGSSSRSVDLYATSDGDACLPVGEYWFETTISLLSDDGDSQSSAAWGFSVSLE
jgi:hypothetical protein